MTAEPGNFEIRELASTTEMKAAERLQLEVWGGNDIPDNSDILLAVKHSGGLVAGAFLNEKLAGFLFAFPTSEANVQQSHRLAVHPSQQRKGLGTKLKWYQRNWCLERGIQNVRWTYDPLRNANAKLNITKLGATVGIYHEDYYGVMEGINAGVPSDRLVAEWQLNAPHVQRKSSTLPETEQTKPTLDAIRIPIPTDFSKMLQQSPDQALSARMFVRDSLISAFAAGYRITDFDARESEYILTQTTEGRPK